MTTLRLDRVTQMGVLVREQAYHCLCHPAVVRTLLCLRMMAAMARRL